jgi:hypothetical protein
MENYSIRVTGRNKQHVKLNKKIALSLNINDFE